ncbi:PepSY-associated TM helix domain-containing protein [Marilutibacter alkalisoli]|uniref:PepSY domain-containing protein n=1 Tax=Marilutibacter alkalisoli TaxID=2591633 RepID=A0A514BQS9_9GAMM|nr:PepSY-associated TM helix domain-containing protein [Lysobacter alkalisoli]QDH69727.1 PepSY domain-containing protein [Lysobacter alkalisoli]
MGQPMPASNDATRKPRGRRLWFDLHSWVGLKLCVLMAFVCLTGTLAVLAHEIDWLLHPPMRVEPAPTHASWGAVLAAARTAHPDWRIDFAEAPEGPRFAARVRVTTPDGQRRFVWVDPYRGTVTGDTAFFNVHRFLRNTHRHLMLPLYIGLPLVAALSIPLAISLLSSLYIYRHWWRGFFVRPRGDRPRRWWGDIHRLAGVWSLGFVALIALTGTWYLVEALGGGARLPSLPEPERLAIAETPIDASPAAIDRAVAEARRRWPAFEIRQVFPWSADGLLLLRGQAEAVLVRPRANVIAFDATDGHWLGHNEARDMGVHQRIAEMADPLHFGNFGGLPVKLVWFAFGALLTTLSLTGAYLYGLRAADALRSARRRDPAAAEHAGPPRPWPLAWRGMMRWRWLATGLLLACAVAWSMAGSTGAT